MAFRFDNPLRRVANTQTAINRGLGQFGEVSQGLAEFDSIQKNIGRISSSIGQISGNSTSLSGTITNIRSAGDVINTLSGPSSIQNTFRSVSALTRDVQSLMPGNSRVVSQAATLSKKAEDLFSNTQRNAQSIRGFTGGVTDVLNGTLDVGNLAGRSLGPLTGGLNLDQLTNGLPGITGASGLTRNIASGLQTSVSSAGIGQIGSSVNRTVDNIVSQAPELQNIRNNPISVVPRSVAELAQPIGERYDGIRQVYNELVAESEFADFTRTSPIPTTSLGQFTDFEERAFAGIRTGAGNSYSKIANPLRNFSSFNYTIQLGILSAEEYNNPDVYRNGGGFKNYIIKSAGGQYDKRYQVDSEFNNDNPGHAEYFIDGLEMDAVIAPNQNTNVSLGTSLTFTVTEPYSMGNFIEAIIGASHEAGFRNYLDAPFCIRIDFVGWGEYGDIPGERIVNPIFIPIKFTKMDFNVDGKGSIYEVKAIPMSETGLGDDINQIKTPINANGDFVHTVLETGARSITNIMNARIGALEDSGAIAPYDRYVIIFPKSRQDLKDYLARDIIDEEALSIDVEERIRDAIGGDPTLSGVSGQQLARTESALRAQYNETNSNIINATIQSVGRAYAKLKTFAEDTNAMNEIGLSVLVEDVAEGGNQGQGSQAGTYDDAILRTARNSPELAPAERSRDYQFNQGMTITEVIERMCVSSEYCRDRATEASTNGTRKWFKIDTYTFIEESPATEAQIGRPPRVYVFSVIPYETDEAKFNGPNERPANTEELKAAAAKEYNYIYTGKNEDILNFDISFNNAFMQTSFANFGMNAAGVAGGTSTSAVARDVSTGSSTGNNSGAGGESATGGLQEQTELNTGGFGDPTGSGDIRRRIAETFHDRIINQTIDMVTAEMEIFGDPFYLPQEMGNFVASPGNSPNTTSEGTMRYQENEVFTVVNFKTPFDYQIDGATMEFPKVVPQFSGLFSVWAVTNSFNGGKFTQTLKMIRRRGQDDPPTDDNRGPVQENPDTDITSETSTGETAVGNTQGGNTVLSRTDTTTPNAPAGGGQTVNTAPTTATNPEGTRFGSMDQALAAGRSYQIANPDFTFAARQLDNGGWTVASRPSTQPQSTVTAPDLSSQVTSGTQANQPTSPAC